MEEDPSVWDNLNKELVQPLRKRLAYDTIQKEIIILPYDIPEVALKPMSAEADRNPKVKPFVGSAGQPPRLRPFLSSGGVWNWLTLNPFLQGHYEVTLEALTEQEGMPWTFSPHAAEVVADASRDPDLFEWKCPAAHAQNPINSTSPRDNRADRGKIEFYKWIKNRLSEIQQAQDENDDRLALYHLGRMLHAIQDLASHRGMDNAEHSWLDQQGDGPDEDAVVNIPLAKALTRDFLDRIVASWPSINYSKLRSNNSAQNWGYFEVQSRLGFSRQLNKQEYDKYKELGKRLPSSLIGLSGIDLEASVVNLKNRWFAPDDWRNMIRDLKEALYNTALMESVEVGCPKS